MKKIILFVFLLFLLVLGIFLINKNAMKNKNNNDNAKQIPVLIYHHFLSDEEKKEYEPEKNYSVSTTAFEKQLKYLKDNGYKSITPKEMLCWKLQKCNLDTKSFMITIDDGQKSVLRYAYPLLKKYGFTATSFVISSRIKNYGDWDPSTYQYYSKEDLKDNGVIYFGSHSDNMHMYVEDEKKLYTMNYDEILQDVSISKEILNTTYFAYPFNTYNKDFTRALREAGYELAFRGQSRKTSLNENRFLISRIFVSEDFDLFKEIFESDKYDYPGDAK